ncbi:HsdM family class I SAM-dependent methyltransferase, partial [Priestia megaterium]
APKIKRDNSLEIDTRDISDEKKVDKIGMNPPFGGVEERSVQTNFKKEFQTSETADLFMVMIMERLKVGGKAGVVLPDGFLFGTEGVKGRIKEKLLKECNLHTIIRLPKGVFAPYTDIPTNLLFFDKTGVTKEVWYYEHQLPEGYKNYTKTRPIRLEEFNAEREWWNNRQEGKYAWKISVEELKNRNYNFDLKNPNTVLQNEGKSSEEIINELCNSYSKVAGLLDTLRQEIYNAKN